ncbi:radical SAM/SPASM domain-containing protein [Methylosinus sp. Sm6]|uniref:radical SAM/SPASM domain-containing protein n=1 Tax=Methylosinus sp. Sm6 TaxID=2866948 RepID=UPI001C9A01DB|nr:radical SAM/SPASM domain-containing protein [Methylosinus sp. Sm6]MBY6241787.1 radical SAM protein [Methylosinus sp. Sm6]
MNKDLFPLYAAGSGRLPFRAFWKRKLRPGGEINEWIERNIRARIRRVKQRHAERALEDADTTRYLRESFCEKPFRKLESTPSGLAYVCCPAWLPTPIGDLKSGAEKVWFGRTARALRKSITDGSFRYCSRVKCADIANRKLISRESPEAKAIIAEFESATPPLPKTLFLSHDRSCNLTCPSCRTHSIVSDKAEQARLDEMTERVLVPLLRAADRVLVTGSGDPFFSNHFRRLIKRIDGEDFRNLRIDLHTNAQLFDERGWNDLRLRGRVRQVEISIDAATPETYAIVRRDGSFERLLDNLAFIKGLRDSGEIEILYFSMVVQRRNFREMPDFVRLARRFSADWASFNMIWNWGTFTPEEFEREYVGAASHPDFEELRKVLQDPLLQPPYAQLGSVPGHVERALRGEAPIEA